MKSNKINATITIDKDVWQLAKVLLPCSRSNFIERQIINYIHSIDDIETLEKEIKEDKEKLAVKELKLNELKELKEKNSKNKDKINKAMQTVFNIVLNNGEISEKQIDNICKINLIDKSIIIDKINNQGFKIVKFTKEYKETGKRYF